MSLSLAVTGHLLPVAHGEASEPWVVAAFVALGVFAAALVGLWLGRTFREDPKMGRLAVGFAAGALLFLLFDLLKESASLGQALVGRTALQLGLLAAFAAGALVIPLLSRGVAQVRLAWAWAFGIGLHGAGEGWIVGTEAAVADLTQPLAAASFLAHKVIEAFTIPLVATCALGAVRWWGLASLVALLALAGAAAGAILGPGLAPLFLFAGGAGAAAYAVLRLASREPPTAGQAAAMALGVITVWAAGLLHEL